MKVTEQIDALESLAINPVRFLILPRFTANTLMMPVLVVMAGFVAIFGGYFVAHFFLNISATTFFAEIPRHFYYYDIFACVVKAFVFGAITSLMGCYIGLNTSGGAEGVGRATILAFVWSSLLILICDYILATLLF
jgi:phospholipid/cholesterol/gamma-HCH transport system permease protein